MKQKTEITFEVEETITLRQSEKVLPAFCQQCGAMVKMTTPRIAGAFAGLSEREIFRLIENGRLHFVEAERVYVCLDSLTNGVELLDLGSSS